ncbi:MAG: ABC transporter permease [Geminicoccaceae bacterium]
MLPLASLALFVLTWQALAISVGDPVRLPAPSAVAGRMVEEAASGRLFYHLGMTLARVAAAFAIAMLIGTAIGIALGRSRLLDSVFDGWLVLLLNLPALVTIVLAYIWIGLTETALIVAVALNKIPNVAVIMREGARALDPDLRDMARAFRLPLQKRIGAIIVPQLTPYLASAARSGLALIWKIVLVTELLGRSSGVGFQIGLYFQLFDVTSILAYACAFIVIILTIEGLLIRPFERRVHRWRR